MRNSQRGTSIVEYLVLIVMIGACCFVALREVGTGIDVLAYNAGRDLGGGTELYQDGPRQGEDPTTQAGPDGRDIPPPPLPVGGFTAAVY